jgi:hypothetical protein
VRRTETEPDRTLSPAHCVKHDAKAAAGLDLSQGRSGRREKPRLARLELSALDLDQHRRGETPLDVIQSLIGFRCGLLVCCTAQNGSSCVPMTESMWDSTKG